MCKLHISACTSLKRMRLLIGRRGSFESAHASETIKTPVTPILTFCWLSKPGVPLTSRTWPAGAARAWGYKPGSIDPALQHVHAADAPPQAGGRDISARNTSPAQAPGWPAARRGLRFEAPRAGRRRPGRVRAAGRGAPTRCTAPCRGTCWAASSSSTCAPSPAHPGTARRAFHGAIPALPLRLQKVPAQVPSDRDITHGELENAQRNGQHLRLIAEAVCPSGFAGA